MWSFFGDLLRNASAEHTVVVMDTEDVGASRRYRLRPTRMMGVWALSLGGAGLLVGLLLAFTPLRKHIPGYGTQQLQQSAQLNTMRLQSLQDSLAAQRRYVRRLRALITGGVDSLAQRGRPGQSSASASAPAQAQRDRAADGTPEAARGVHQQPALSPFAASTTDPAPGGERAALSFPLPPPVTNGFPTRGFDATTGHYGIDVAVSEGEYIRAVADGYVVWADWTQDGGYTIAVQHADGYLSVYKHNKRLLERLGARVRAQEPLAVSGDTGAISTGPHLHFEMWRNGLAQDPESYVTGW